ncbi:MAG: hypothetical protein Tsb0014_25560 [Pleurocapsa sp.]
MEKFLRKLGLFVLINSVIIIAFSLVGHGRYTDYISTIGDKHKLAKENDSPKILLAGGSNIAFGLSAEQIEQNLNLKAVNLGLNVGLSISFILEEAKSLAQAGDVIVLSIEPGMFPGSAKLDRPRSDLVFKLAMTHPQYLNIYLTNYKVLLDQGYQGIGGMFFTGMKDTLMSVLGKPIYTEKIYNRNSFSDRGDLNAHCGLPRNLTQTKFTGTSAYGAIWTSEHDERIKQIQSFSEELENRGVAVYYTFAPIPATNWKSSSAIANIIKEKLNNIKTIQLLDSPATQVYSDDIFYDTENHLNCEGRTQRTSLVIRNLKSLRHLP